MERSEQLNELAAALVAVQAEVPAIPKTESNPFFKSKYADFASVKAIADPVAAKHGLAVAQFPSCTDNGGDTLITVLLHTSGQFMESEMRLHLPKADPQGQGSALTYAKRYAYMAALGLVADVDDDGNAASNRQGNSSGGKSRSGAAATNSKQSRGTNSDRPKGSTSTSSAPENLQPLMLKELSGAQKPAFLKWFGDNLPNDSLTAVPVAVKGTVEKAINAFACGEVPPSMEEPF